MIINYHSGRTERRGEHVEKAGIAAGVPADNFEPGEQAHNQFEVTERGSDVFGADLVRQAHHFASKHPDVLGDATVPVISGHALFRFDNFSRDGIAEKRLYTFGFVLEFTFLLAGDV
ncbi:hypothetical protein EUZ85_26910 [Hahella sp. KA22]|nr:hypothetical protein ENC22_24325 [Hahella sp. KA22]QAY57526.1 hypothetical protein EUZ85_26910 [Hahella sp. KA22]